ncbi:MAG TPA: hypothetical protein PKM63_05515 [Panacibacter sp.]|nr:hypothetical protein [Panacibacter sp.]HNP43721.1 hypothetical protein [Panacibacter sp.]
MSTIIIHNANLKPDNPKADIVVPVETGDNVHEKVAALAHCIQKQIECIAPGCYNELHVLCDNSPEGLLLGTLINAGNIESIFQPLKYKIGNIHILCRNAASNYQHANDGMLMCRRLAQATYANVRASNTCNCKTDVVTWSQRGQIIMLERYDEQMRLTESYDHPGTLLLHEFKTLCKKTNDPRTSQKAAQKSSRIRTGYSRLLHFILPHTFFSRHVPLHAKAK